MIPNMAYIKRKNEGKEGGKEKPGVGVLHVDACQAAAPGRKERRVKKRGRR